MTCKSPGVGITVSSAHLIGKYKVLVKVISKPLQNIGITPILGSLHNSFTETVIAPTEFR